MLRRVKKFLGIEGVKVELEIPETITKQMDSIEGKLLFSSLNVQLVQRVTIVVVERFSRGRRKEKLTDEYELSREEKELNLEVGPDNPKAVDFSIPFSQLKSEMDELEEKNFLLRSLVKSAKWLRNVKSSYRIEVEAKVKGVALDPFDKKSFTVK